MVKYSLLKDLTPKKDQFVFISKLMSKGNFYQSGVNWTERPNSANYKQIAEKIEQQSLDYWSHLYQIKNPKIKEIIFLNVVASKKNYIVQFITIFKK